MNKKTFIKLSTTLIASFISLCSNAANYGVNLEWNVKQKQEAMKKGPSQEPSFTKMVKSGEIKEVYISNKSEKGSDISSVNFVIDAENEGHVRQKIAQLPLYKQGIIRVKGVVPLGSKWLDTTPTYKNYALSFYWKENIEPTELNRVLAVDLQRVVALNQAGLITSSYIHTQDEGDDFIKPVYLISVLADDEQHALELSKQFESVIQNYVDVDVKFLGRKLKLEQ